MSFARTDELFNACVVEAIKNPGIHDPAALLGITDKLLEEAAEKIKERAWNSAPKEISAYDEVHNQYTANLKTLENVGPRDISGRLAFLFWHALILFVFLAIAIFKGFNGAVTFLQAHLGWDFFIWIFGWLITFGIVNSRQEGKAKLARNRKHEELGIAEQEIRLAELKQAIKDQLTQFIVQELTVYINKQTDASFSNTLSVLSQAGLAEVPDASYYIATLAQEKVLHLVDTVPGASIGIAGPRGVGKTSLLSFIAQNRGTDAQPILAVLTSAPVEYTPREFILHLYSAVCRKVLYPEGVSEPEDSLQDLLAREAESLSRPPQKWRPIGPLLMVLGIVMLALGLVLAGLKSAAKSTQAAATPTATAAPVSNTTVSSGMAFLNAIDIQPWPIIQSGIFFFLLGSAIVVLYGETSVPYRKSGIRSLLQVWPRLRLFLIGHKPTPPKELRTPRDRLKEIARKRLEEIRFQQSYSSGWSGALKVPVGIESGITTGMSWARNQMSLPELVDSFRSFLVNAGSQYYRIIVCIDELDKLEADEKAHQFLNQIKAVFGIPKCFYFISVSENAISSFERRGLPFRDVFDSSLDTIFYMDYLDLASSRLLLARRVIGLPVPFLFVCHCMAAGLPRDLLRVCRELLELKKPGVHDQLDDLVVSLIKIDVQSKVRAISIAAQQIRLEPDISRFLTAVGFIDAAEMQGGALLQHAQNVLSSSAPTSAPTADAEVERQKLQALKLELGAYLAYCATLLEFVQGKITSRHWQAVEKSDSIDRLARSRQALAIDPHLCIARLSEFRKHENMNGIDNLIVGLMQDSISPPAIVQSPPAIDA